MESVKILHDSNTLGLCQMIENHLSSKGILSKRTLIDPGFSLSQITDFHGSTKVVVVLISKPSIVSRWGRTLFSGLIADEDKSAYRAMAIFWTKLNSELLTSSTRTFFYPRTRVHEIATAIENATPRRETIPS